MISCAAMMRSEPAFRKPVDSRLALLAVEADEGYLWFWIGSQVRGSDGDGSHAASTTATAAATTITSVS